MRKTVLHGSHISESAAGIAHGKGRSGLASEEKQSRIFLGRICRLFFICIYVIKNRIACFCIFPEVVGDLHCLIRVHIVIPCQAQCPQRITVIIPVIHWEYQPAVISKSRMLCNFFYSGLSCKGLAHVLVSPDGLPVRLYGLLPAAA